jgi:hypothetical protein
METDQLSLGYVGVEVNDEGFRSTVRQDWNEHTPERVQSCQRLESDAHESKRPNFQQRDRNMCNKLQSTSSSYDRTRK